MIRVGLYTQDRALQPLLSSATGLEFQFFSESTEEGIRRLVEDENCDIVILDLNPSNSEIRDRMEATSRLIADGFNVVVLAEDSMRTTASELVDEGAFGSVRRPPSMRDLRSMLRRAYENSPVKMNPEPVVQETSDPRMIGSSEAMQQVYQLVECVARIDASVLIVGESGTGKELVARAIHSEGPKARKPFVAVSCGAIPESLIEAELFGHEKGAFTGAAGSREGYFEQAADGTLFLDEIGELSLYTQVKLLRVLQQREFSRLGSTKLIPLRARLVFATHRNLEELVAEGKFRQDLYYRINVMKIETPCLNEHADDIPQIALHFLRQYAKSFGKPVTSIEPAAMEILQSYVWPGNVRELENAMQQAVIMSEGRTVRAADLPGHLQIERIMETPEALPAGSFERQLRDYKVRLAESAVRDHNGNKTLAARSLHISRAYLHRLIRASDPVTGFIPPEAIESLEPVRVN